MNYDKLTVANKNFIKRFSHSQRFIIASKLISKYRSHIGFNYLNFIKFLKKENLQIVETCYSTFNILRGLINSQIFIITKFKHQNKNQIKVN